MSRKAAGVQRTRLTYHAFLSWCRSPSYTAGNRLQQPITDDNADAQQRNNKPSSSDVPPDMKGSTRNKWRGSCHRTSTITDDTLTMHEYAAEERGGNVKILTWKAC